MNNTKKIILEQDIDSARCRGHWVLVKLLAAKYRDRYVENSALGALILGEATLNTTLSSNPKRCFDILDSSSNLRKNVSLIYAKNEALNNAQQESLKEATNFLENAAAKFKDLNRHFYMQCNILLAKIYLETGRFQLAIEQLQDLDYQVPLEEIVEDVGQYGKAIMLMGSVIKGLAYLLLGQEEVAFEIISIAASMAHLQFTKTLPTEYPNIKSSLFTQHPKSNQNQWGHWLEYLLFLHIILGFKLGHGAVDSVLLSLNTYLDNIREISHEGFVAVPISSHDSSFSQSTLFFSNDTRKIPILQLYITKLLEKTNDFSLSFSNIPIIPMNKTYLKPEIYIEIMKYIPIFEVLVTSVIQFPQGEDKSYLGSERLSRVKRCYDIWAILLINKPADEIFQAYVDRHYKLIEACYRGTKHTFHSLKLLRYLAHTFASLLKINHDDMPTEEKREAEKVVDSYVFLLNKHLTELIEQAQKKKLEEKVVEYRKRRSTLISANPNTPLEPITPKFLANPKVVISSVDGESIADAIGVYFSGIRILLLNVEGEEDKLRTALTYAQNALTLFNDHGVSILESENVSTKKPRKALYDFIKQKIYQYLGITYGELALEVRDSDLRQEFQKEAVKALNIAAELASEENSWDLLYQLSLQLAEVGEIEKAIVTINKSLALNASHSSSWNLLALCLSSKKEYSQAIKVCDAGFKEAISRLTRKNTLDPNRGSFSWDDVEDSIKEDLINLKMTEMVIDVGLNGPNSGLTNLQEIFKWYRKFFNVGSIGSLGRSEPKHRMAVSVTSPSCASIPLSYRFRVYDLFVSLWLAASSLYRTIGEFEVAYSCISEADTVVSNIVRSDDFQRKKFPRLFDPDQGTNKKNPSSEFDIRLTKKWGLEVPFVRRVLSDILFEAAMIKHAEYNAQILRNTNSFTFSPADTKYLSPVVQAEADYKAKKQANMSNRAGGFYKRGNMSNISVATTNSAGGYFSANLSPSNNINHINLLMVKSYSQASLTEPTSNGERLRPDVTLDSLTAEFLFISQLDDDHIPTRVHLGLLALERGDAYLAENLLERAMKRGKARGCSGGKSGIASYYGGITGVWGWEAWKALGKVMNKTKRMNEARECFSFAVDIEKASPVRGFECLSRLVKGKEW